MRGLFFLVSLGKPLEGVVPATVEAEAKVCP